MTDLHTHFERLLPWIRAQFPQLERLRDGRPRTYLDNAAGTMVVQTAADAMRDAALWANPQPERAWPPAPETARAHAETRSLLLDFLNAPAGDAVYLSESTTASFYKLREALEPEWEPGDNVVVTDCDHFANISPWEWRARWEVRRARMLPDGHLDLDHLASLLDGRTRVAAVTMAGNGLGTITRLDAALRLARERAPRAATVVDAVHAAPHLPIDAASLGADALAFSTYKLYGPNCGVLHLRRELAERLEAYHVEPHTGVSTRLEWGTLSNVSVVGIHAALAYLQRIGERLEPAAVGRLADYSRGRRLFKLALEAIRQHEQALSRRVLEGLSGLPSVSVFGVTDPGRARERVPTFAFALAAAPDEEIERRLWETASLQVASGSHYAGGILRGLGRRTAVRASFAHYNDGADAQAFLDALGALQ